MKLSQALEARVLHVLPLPNHFLAVHFAIPSLGDGDGADEEDEFRLVSLAGIPALRGLVGHWDLVRQVRVVRDGKALAWPDGQWIPAHWLLLAPTSMALRPEALRDMTAPVRRHKRAQMH